MSPDPAPLPSRVRFAKAQLTRALTALENVDPHKLDTGIRVLELEDQLADAREDAADWRRKYHALRQVMAAGQTNEGSW